MYKARTDAVFLLTWLNYGADKSILVVDTVNLPRDCRAIAQVRDPCCPRRACRRHGLEESDLGGGGGRAPVRGEVVARGGRRR
jgi:hypothetical protein